MAERIPFRFRGKNAIQKIAKAKSPAKSESFPVINPGYISFKKWSFAPKTRRENRNKGDKSKSVRRTVKDTKEGKQKTIFGFRVPQDVS